jgi:hypothetical protein
MEPRVPSIRRRRLPHGALLHVRTSAIPFSHSRMLAPFVFTPGLLPDAVS